eukprot:7349802-Karenia_brevis.AAC.1
MHAQPTQCELVYARIKAGASRFSHCFESKTLRSMFAPIVFIQMSGTHGNELMCIYVLHSPVGQGYKKAIKTMSMAVKP